MALLNLFKKKPTNWDVFKNFLIRDCYIPFNKLNTIDTAIDTIVKTAVSDKEQSTVFAVNGINDDDRFILQMGVAARLADAKFSVSILPNGNEAELTEALNQWKPQKCKIAIGEETTCKSKKGKAYVNLYGQLASSQITGGIVYIYDASKVIGDITFKCINI